MLTLRPICTCIRLHGDRLQVGDLFQAMRAEDDFEYCEAIGLLCNSIGFELIVSARDFATKIPGGDPTETINLLENCLSLICAVLGNEFDEISQQVLPFVREYLQYCKDSVKAGGPMLAGRRQNVARILETVLAKLRYDNEFNHDSKNDDDQVQPPSLHRCPSPARCVAVVFL